jgi:hypothetical protein
MKTYLSRRIPVVVATSLALAMLALGFLAALGVRSLVAGTASASPAAPNPGHEWSQVEGHGIDGSTYWLGTTADQALELRVNNARALRLEPNATSPNVVGGYSGNSVTVGAVGTTVGGGGSGGNTNRVTDDYGTVAGGGNNQAGDAAGDTTDAHHATVSGGESNIAGGWSTVGGGAQNTAGGGGTVGGGFQNAAYGSEFPTVGGGRNNTASHQSTTIAGGRYNGASYYFATVGGGSANGAGGFAATVAGGEYNTANGSRATVGGGDHNTAGGSYATVPGGTWNTAQGSYSFAAGRQAKANNQGCFVWGDSSNADVACNDNNRWVARASGGVYLYTNSALTAGSYLAAGSSSWSTVSARDLKENFTTVDGQQVLARVAEIPMTTWNYKAQDASIRHMGPMAQDFYAAFGLGDSDTSITTVDADGVALAAIQGLYQLSQGQADRIQALEEDNAALRQRLDGLEARVAALEEGTDVSAAVSQASASGLPTPWLLLGGGLTLALGGLVLVQRRLVGGRR